MLRELSPNPLYGRQEVSDAAAQGIIRAVMDDATVGPRETARTRVGIYLVLTLTLSSVFWFLIIRAGRLGAAGGAYVYALMWSPGVAAIVASLATRRPLSQIGWRWPAWRYIGLAWLIPFAYAAAAYVPTWIRGLGTFPNRSFVSTQASRLHMSHLPLSPT